MTVSAGRSVRSGSVDRASCHDGLVARPAGAEFAHSDLQPVAYISLRVTRQHLFLKHLGEGDVGDAARLCHSGDLALILVPALRLDHSADRHERRLEDPLVALELLVGHVRRLESDRGKRRELSSKQVEDRTAGQPDQDPGLYTVFGEFGRGLIAVASISEHDHLVGGHQHPSVGSGETGQPAHVGEIADQQGLSVVEACPYTFAPSGEIHRRDHDDSNLAATASTARRYPCMPKPMIEPVDTGAITLVCRHGSRAFGLDM